MTDEEDGIITLNGEKFYIIQYQYHSPRLEYSLNFRRTIDWEAKFGEADFTIYCNPKENTFEQFSKIAENGMFGKEVELVVMKKKIIGYIQDHNLDYNQFDIPKIRVHFVEYINSSLNEEIESLKVRLQLQNATLDEKAIEDKAIELLNSWRKS